MIRLTRESQNSKAELLKLLEERDRRKRMRKIDTYFPETGPLRRDLYQKHMRFFAAGKTVRERCSLSANRVGKTESLGGYELTVHLTGQYPPWWEGRRFDRPTLCWAAGDSGKTVRDILQAKLLGPYGSFGTGLIPGAVIVDHKVKSGVADAVELVYVRHTSGGISTLIFKSYDQGRVAFQGNEPDVILEDEEAPEKVHLECVTRTMTNDGMVLVTYTPLEGLTPTVLMFAPNGEMNEGINPESGRFLINITWDDVPHLTEKMKAELLRSYPPYMRDARSKGIPQLGSGAIYPVPETEITVDDFAIPNSWPRAYGLDVGWNWTAAAWGAKGQDDTIYIYSVHKRAQSEPSIHAAAIRGRGEWIPGVIDPASKGRNQSDGENLMDDYKNLGLSLAPAINSVESGLYDVWEKLSTGKIKVFKSCMPFFNEYRLYRRDDKGKVVKDNDHIMDAFRYLIVSGMDGAIPKPVGGILPLERTADYGYDEMNKVKRNPTKGKAWV